MTKNEFALECMDRVNEMAATQPGGSPVETANFDVAGNQMFFHEDGDDDFSTDEMIVWFNIMVNDEDNLDDEMITHEMFKTRRKGISLGFITEDTPKTW